MRGFVFRIGLSSSWKTFRDDGRSVFGHGFGRTVQEMTLHLTACDGTLHSAGVEEGSVALGAVTGKIVIAGVDHTGIATFVTGVHVVPFFCEEQ